MNYLEQIKNIDADLIMMRRDLKKFEGDKSDLAVWACDQILKGIEYMEGLKVNNLNSLEKQREIEARDEIIANQSKSGNEGDGVDLIKVNFMSVGDSFEWNRLLPIRPMVGDILWLPDSDNNPLKYVVRSVTIDLHADVHPEDIDIFCEISEV